MAIYPEESKIHRIYPHIILDMENTVLRTLAKHIVNIDIYIACICLALLIFVVFSNVVLRYLFNAPYQWGEEVEMMLIVWLIWYGGSCAFRMGSQICVDMVLSLLPQKVQKVINVLIYVLSLVILLFLAKQGFAYVVQLAQTNRVTESLHISRAVIYSCMPIGCVLMALNMTYAAVKEFKGGKKDA